MRAELRCIMHQFLPVLRGSNVEVVLPSGTASATRRLKRNKLTPAVHNNLVPRSHPVLSDPLGIEQEACELGSTDTCTALPADHHHEEVGGRRFE